MKYLLLVNGDESSWQARSDEERTAAMAEYERFGEDLRSSGAYVDSARLSPTTTATTVRVRGGETLTTDGPFAETKEQLGGFYLIDVETLDEALAWAARIPAARDGSIEVRPLWPVPAEVTA